MDNKPYVKNITYKIKYLPAWVYAAIVKADPESRDKLLQITDLLNSYEFPEDSIEFTENHIIFRKFPILINIKYIIGYIMDGLCDFKTGAKHRQGIIGIGGYEFIPSSENDSKFIIEKCIYYDILNYHIDCDCSYSAIEIYITRVKIDDKNDEIEIEFRRKI